MTDDLLPCPFCGAEAERHTLPDDEFGNGGGDVIECTGCSASSHVEFGRKENLESSWNRRAPASATHWQGPESEAPRLTDAERVKRMQDAHWTTAKDYWKARAEKAESRVAELEAEVERLKHDGFLARVARYFDASELAGSFLSEDGDGGFLAAIHGMTKEIARLRAEDLSRTGAVTVKPLVWDKGRAETPFGPYHVIEETNDDEPFWFVIFNGKAASRCGTHGDEASAIAAAQADYEARILSALQTGDA